MRTVGILLCLVLSVGIIPPMAAARALVFHVAPEGDDSWSGRLSRPKRDGGDGPFATVRRAQEAVRALRAEMEKTPRPVDVVVHNGTFFLSEPIIFQAQDSGSASAPVTYRAARGARPLFSGGVPLSGWSEATHRGLRAWQLEIPEVREGTFNIRQLFVNGRRRPRTRIPEEGFLHFTGLPEVTPETTWGQGQTMASFAPGDLGPWKNLGDVEIVALHLWCDSRLPIASIDAASATVHFAKRSRFRLTDDNMGAGATAGGRYYVENVAEALDTPGQWYLDRPSGILTYLPLSDESPETAEVIAPRLTHLVRLEPGARHIHLRGLTFSHTEWSLPEDQAGSPQAEVIVPGALLLQGAESCRVEDCTVSHIANYAVELIEGATYCAVVGCRLFDLGAGGVKVGPDTAFTTVSDNSIEDGGILYHAAVGVWIGNSGDNSVIHNHIARFYYTGISVGWVWGYHPSKGVRNRVEYNHIHDIGRGLLSDMGGIYTLGVSPGTVLRHNLIHDVSAYRYGGWGIYPDEGSTDILIENNLVYRTNSAPFHQHYGRENIVRNNIFAFGDHAQIMRTRAEEHIMFRFHHNIVVSANGKIAAGRDWSERNASFDNNMYYDVDGNGLEFAGMPFADWQAKGFDRNSLIADPLFADWRNGDFRLRRGSPALDLGFRRFDISKVGPRARR